MDHALGHPFMVELGHLLAEMKVLHQRRSTMARFQGIVVVLDPMSLIGREKASFGHARLLGVARSSRGGLVIAVGPRHDRDGECCCQDGCEDYCRSHIWHTHELRVYRSHVSSSVNSSYCPQTRRNAAAITTSKCPRPCLLRLRL